MFKYFPFLPIYEVKEEEKMGPVTTNIVISLATNYFTEFTVSAVKKFFEKAISEKPEIEEKLLRAGNSKDFEEIFNEATGIVDATANTSELKVIGTFLEALKGIRFDHADGKVLIKGTVMEAPVLVTGGRIDSSGSTVIEGGSKLKSRGTSIDVGEGSGIIIEGDAQIRQD